jgi:hypothetical protein
MTTSNKLPAVLTFPDGKQSSISLERAIKNALEMLIEFDNTYTSGGKIGLDAAIDDLELMLGAIER